MTSNNKKSLRTISFMLFLVLLIVATQAYGSEDPDAYSNEEYCYVPYGTGVHPEFIAGTSLIKMNWVEGERGMVAYASYLYDEETNSTICLITARMPDQVIGDPEMDSLGHELLHCMTGEFHTGMH